MGIELPWNFKKNTSKRTAVHFAGESWATVFSNDSYVFSCKCPMRATNSAMDDARFKVEGFEVRPYTLEGLKPQFEFQFMWLFCSMFRQAEHVLIATRAMLLPLTEAAAGQKYSRFI